MSALRFVLFFAAIGFLSGAVTDFLSVRRPSLARTLRLPSAGPAVAIGAGLGAFAVGRPTAVVQLDVVLRSAFAGLVVVFALRASRWVVSGAAVSVAGASIVGASRALASSGLLIAVGLSLGVAVVQLVVPRIHPIVKGPLAVGLSFLVLRIPTAGPSRLPSAVGLVVILALFASSYRAATSSWRLWSRRVGLGVGGVVLLSGVAGASALWSARADAESGVTAARAGLQFARVGARDQAERSFTTASSFLARTQNGLESPLGHVGLIVPVLSQHLRTLDSLSGIADEVVTSARLTTGEANLASFKSTNGAIDLDAVRLLSVSLARTVRSLDDAQRVLRRPSGPWLLPQVAQRFRSLRDELEDADREAGELLRLTQRLPSMLGDSGERRYLLVLPTPAETRGSGGVIGNYGEIVARDGRFELSRFGRQIDLAGGTPAERRTLSGPPEFLARYEKFGVSSTWSNVNMSPDFVSAASAMAELYPQSGGREVDGVISADPFVLEALLALLGPLQVAGWPTPLDGTNTARVLLHESYVANPDEQDGRVSLLANVATGVWERLRTATLPDPQLLVRTLSPTVRHRHLQIWMRDEADQRYLDSVGLTGAVSPTLGDSFAVVVNNASGNKIEYFLHREISYTADLRRVGSRVDADRIGVRATVQVDLRNDAPAAGLPDYIIGNLVKVDPPPRGTSLTYVSFYSPLLLEQIRLDGATIAGSELETERELGRNVYSLWLRLPSSTTRRLEIVLRGDVATSPTGYRLTVFTQPTVNPDALEVNLVTGAGGPRSVFETATPRAVEEIREE